MEVLDLFQALQAAYVKVKEREEVRDQAQASFSAAQQDYVSALNDLNEKRSELNDILGTTAGDVRVRQG